MPRAAAAPAALLVLAACVIETEGKDGRPDTLFAFGGSWAETPSPLDSIVRREVAADSAAGEVILVDTAAAADVLGAAAESLPADGDAPEGPAYDSLSALGDRAATDGPTPLDGELLALRRRLVVPVRGVERSALLDSYDAARGANRVHQAIDIPAPRGTPVLSADDGRLLKLFTSDAGGRMVYAVDASGRFILMYAHLDRYADGLADGMPLRRGQVIGHVGTTGNAPPNVPHLHFAVARTADPDTWWEGTPVNPYPLLAP